MYDCIKVDPVDKFSVTDIPPDEGIARQMFYVPEVFEIARIGEFVEVDDGMLGMRRKEMPDEVGTDETRAAGNQDLHQ
jgi:hypothetical protein